MDIWWLQNIWQKDYTTCDPNGDGCKFIPTKVKKNASKIRTSSQERAQKVTLFQSYFSYLSFPLSSQSGSSQEKAWIHLVMHRLLQLEMSLTKKELFGSSHGIYSWMCLRIGYVVIAGWILGI